MATCQEIAVEKGFYVKGPFSYEISQIKYSSLDNPSWLGHMVTLAYQKLGLHWKKMEKTEFSNILS